MQQTKVKVELKRKAKSKRLSPPRISYRKFRPSSDEESSTDSPSIESDEDVDKSDKTIIDVAPVVSKKVKNRRTAGPSSECSEEKSQEQHVDLTDLPDVPKGTRSSFLAVFAQTLNREMCPRACQLSHSNVEIL